MRKWISCMGALLLTLSVFGKYGGLVRLDRRDGKYKVGDTITCKVKLTKDGKALKGTKARMTLKFEGKTIKVQGYFYVYESDIRNVYVCLVPDSTACCTAGLEFRLAGEHKFPDDYPASDELITAAGTFGAYSDDEGEHIAYELQDAYFLS